MKKTLLSGSSSDGSIYLDLEALDLVAVQYDQLLLERNPLMWKHVWNPIT